MSKNSGIFEQIIQNFYKIIKYCHTHNLLHVGLGGGSVAAASCGLKSISVEIDAFFHLAALGRMKKFADEPSMLFHENESTYETNYQAHRGVLRFSGPFCDEDKRLESTFRVQTITHRYEHAR
jgi:hypothetical protein